MQCYIYRSSIQEGLYVYLAKEDGLSSLPPAVLKQLGNPEFSMALDLHPHRKLGQEDVAIVLENLELNGFHVQMPRDIEDQLEVISRNATLKQQSH